MKAAIVVEQDSVEAAFRPAPRSVALPKRRRRDSRITNHDSLFLTCGK